MIPATIGRVVLFWPAVPANGVQRTQPQPALISYVWSDRLINIGGFDANGIPFGATSVPLLQDDEVTPAGYYAEWMPYQKTQAAKHDASSTTPSADTTYEAVCAAWHGAQLSPRQMPWRTAVEILSVVKKLPDAEREKLLALDELPATAR